MKISARSTTRVKARAWLLMNEIRQTDIMLALGHKSVNQVHSTLHGFRNDRRVLRYLLDLGCPAKYLNLPADMRKAA